MAITKINQFQTKFWIVIQDNVKETGQVVCLEYLCDDDNDNTSANVSLSANRASLIVNEVESHLDQIVGVVAVMSHVSASPHTWYKMCPHISPAQKGWLNMTEKLWKFCSSLIIL